MKPYQLMNEGHIQLDRHSEISNIDNVKGLLEFYVITPQIISMNPVVTYGDDRRFIIIYLESKILYQFYQLQLHFLHKIQ